MTTTKKPPLITFFAILLVLIGPISIDLYLPALPAMAEIFSNHVSKSIGIFTIGIGLGQIMFGPLSDQYGRRPIILIGITIFTISSLLIKFLSNELLTLLLFRFTQGLGASATAVCCTAMIRDCFDGPKLAQRYSIISASLNVIPALAPALGAVLFEYWDWRSAFVFLAIYGVCVGLIFTFFFKETRQKLPKDHINLTWIDLFKHRSLRCYTICCASGLALILSYVSSSSHVLMDISGVNKNVFALYFGLNALLIIIGNLITARLVMRFHPLILLKVGLGLWMSAGILMLILSYLIHPLSYMIPIGILSFGFPFVLGPANSLAMQSFKEGAGRAAAFIGCLQMLIGSSFSMLMSTLPLNPKIILGIMAVSFSILCFTVITRNQKYQQSH